MGRKANHASLGRSLMKKNKPGWDAGTRGVTDRHTKEEVGAGLKSVTEETSYDEVIATAAPTNEELNKEMTAEELDDAEKEAFLQWRRSMATLQEKEGITPLERDIEVCSLRLIETFLEPSSYLLEKPSILLDFLKVFKFRIEFTKKLKKIVEIRINSKLTIAEEWMKNVLKLTKIIVKAESMYLLDEKVERSENQRNYFKKEFSKLWNEIMKWNGMTPAIVRQIVTLLPDQLMDHLQKPMHMSDFLLESFKINGPISILSLRGIFILMIKYNFDVPDFYTKLYSLFNLPVVQSTYRTRFFRYSNDFLSSTHLPEYLVAAFVKKLCRISLHAPAPVIPLICNFVINLMIKHQGLQVLIHNTKTNNSNSVDTDPFDDKELNPNKTRAMESSLWEMKTLQNHILPIVAQACSFIEKPLPKVEYDLEETLTMDYDDIFETEVERKKNIDPVEPKFFDSFDFEFSSSLQTLSDSVHGLNPKRAKIL